MARIKIDIPKTSHYSVVIPIRISDINYGGHLGNDAVLSLVHEARIKFLVSLGYTEFDVEGVGIIMNDAALVFKSEAFYGESVSVVISVGEFHKYGCDIYYMLTDSASGREIARVKTGIIFFNYHTRAIEPVPEAFQKRF